jgi:hypothetical protein
MTKAGLSSSHMSVFINSSHSLSALHSARHSVQKMHGVNMWCLPEARWVKTWQRNLHTWSLPSAHTTKAILCVSFTANGQATATNVYLGEKVKITCDEGYVSPFWKHMFYTSCSECCACFVLIHTWQTYAVPHVFYRYEQFGLGEYEPKCLVGCIFQQAKPCVRELHISTRYIVIFSLPGNVFQHMSSVLMPTHTMYAQICSHAALPCTCEKMFPVSWNESIRADYTPAHFAK